MPPKPKYTKEEIVNAAFELTREKGIDMVAAREVGKRLNTSPSPIFTVWNGMEELKAVSDYITAPVMEDGIAKALRHFGLLD